MKLIGPLLAIAVCLSSLHGIQADERVSFEQEILPLLKSKCFSCHGSEKQEGGLRLDSAAAALAGGDRGPAIVPEETNKSLLLEAISSQNPDLQMPPKQPLSDREVAIFAKWISEGADWPESQPSEDSPGETGNAFTDPRNPIRVLFGMDRLDLWSLKKPVAILPESVQPDTATDDRISPSQIIDAFLQDRLRKEQITPLPEADRRTLIRRLTLDLTGLPPTPEEVKEFLDDPSPNAYSVLVDRLLASPRYGERQARLWLDVVRYADTHGYERDEFRPLAWKYRDYVIRSFNHDKPFDQFIREQLAGDELLNQRPRNSAEADLLTATGYLRLGQWDSTAAIFQEEERLRAEQMADLTNTTASAFLALTMSCCQCHDHKYDPLSQADHFRMRAFFAAVQPVDDQPVSTVDEQAAIDQHNAGLDAEITPLRMELENLNPDVESGRVRQEELQKQIAAIDAKKQQPERAMTAADSGGSAPPTHIFYQGDFSSPREEVQPGFVSVLYPGSATIEPPRDNTTGRRLSLANWIASPENPWTARVIVNRIWQQHFGTGIVATANDFSYSGTLPSHPELLDWLAVEFMRQGWSIRKLHRWIVNTAAYRRSSIDPAAVALERTELDASADSVRASLIDPSNSLLWRQNVRRLDAETLRDSLLAVSGLLLPYLEGPPLWPHVPDELTHAQPAILEAIKDGDDGRMQGWYTDPVERTDVRSVFLIRKRCLPIPFLQAFDLPETTTSCARRDSTVVAPQALMLLNSPEGVRYAQSLARRLIAENSPLPQDDRARRAKLVDRLFQVTLNRSPDAEEQDQAIAFLTKQTETHAVLGEASETQATIDLCRAFLNLNEFVYVD